MDRSSQPQRGPKAEHQGAADGRGIATHVRIHNDNGVLVLSGVEALAPGKQTEHAVAVALHLVVDLAALPHGRVAPGAVDKDHDDEDEAHGDDGAGVGPGAQHPGAVLLDLQALDVVVGHGEGADEDDGQEPRRRLRVDGAAGRPARDHQGAHRRGQGQQHDDVAVDAVHQDRPVADGRDELEARQERGRDDGEEVQHHADLHVAALKVVLFAALAPLEGAPVVEVGHAGEAEAHEGAAKDEEEDEVVALGEADGVVYLAAKGDEAVGRRSCWLDHLCGGVQGFRGSGAI